MREWMKKMALWLVVLVLALGAMPVGASESTDILAAPSDAVLARVNGEAITKGDIQHRFHALVTKYSGIYNPEDDNQRRTLYEEALFTHVQTVMVRQQAAALGLDTFTEQEEADLRAKGDKSFDAMIEEFKAAMKSEEEIDEAERLEAIEQSMVALGYTRESYAQIMRDAALTERLMAHAAEGVSVTDDEVRAEYDRRVADAKARYDEAPTAFVTDMLADKTIYYTPDGIRTVKHILIQSIEDATTDDAILAIHAYIEAGEDFDVLLTAYGQDIGMKQGSKYYVTGYYVCDGATQYDARFVEAAMALEQVGDISAPITTGYGAEIIKYHMDVPAGEADFDSVREATQNVLLAARRSAAFSDMMRPFSENSHIEVLY